jgi:hypothetical protein
MNRRGFLGSILALAAAPAIVKASSLMPVRDRYIRYSIGELDQIILFEAPYSAAKCESFIPELWSSKLAHSFYNNMRLEMSGIAGLYRVDAAKALAMKIDSDMDRWILESYREENQGREGDARIQIGHPPQWLEEGAGR